MDLASRLVVLFFADFGSVGGPGCGMASHGRGKCRDGSEQTTQDTMRLHTKSVGWAVLELPPKIQWWGFVLSPQTRA